MATQGLVTITKDGAVIMKIVAGSQGMNAAKIAEKIRKNPALARNTALAYMTAINAGFGEKDNLVVVGMVNEFERTDKEVSHLYRSTFKTPEFNPRLESGETEYYELIEL